MDYDKIISQIPQMTAVQLDAFISNLIKTQSRIAGYEGYFVVLTMVKESCELEISKQSKQ